MEQLKVLSIVLNLATLIVSDYIDDTTSPSYEVTTHVFEGNLENCLNNMCIRKCCGEHFVLNGTTCVYSNFNEFQVTIYEQNQTVTDNLSTFSIISGLMSCPKELQYRLSPKEFKDDAFLVQNDGRLWQPTTNNFIENDQYCLEYFEDIHMSALVCMMSKSKRIGRGLNAIGMMISMPFLLATFIVYALIPERNLHKTYLMCYVFALFCAYFVLVFVQIRASSMTVVTCTVMGIFCIFFFLASFFWTNVISLDIWWTFSGARGLTDRNEYERRRFLLYSAYAWGCPLLLVLLVILTSFVATPNRWYNPGIGDGHCWFHNKVSELFYFYGPIAIILVANIVLFTRTYLEIRKVQQSSSSLRKHVGKKKNFEENKQKFNLYLKLMLAMGLNWTMEIISWLVDWQSSNVPAAVWYLTDFCNALYGVFIFFIFVFKQSVLDSLKRRYYMVTGKLHKARSMLGRSETPATTETSL